MCRGEGGGGSYTIDDVKQGVCGKLADSFYKIHHDSAKWVKICGDFKERYFFDYIRTVIYFAPSLLFNEQTRTTPHCDMARKIVPQRTAKVL